MLVDDRTSAEDERTGAMMLPLHRRVAAELEHVVARDLRVVGREVARLLAFVVVALGLPVRLDRQVAAAAAVVHDRWQVKQAISSSLWASLACGHAGPERRACRSPRRSCDISLARAALGLKSRAGADRRCP